MDDKPVGLESTTEWKLGVREGCLNLSGLFSMPKTYFKEAGYATDSLNGKPEWLWSSYFSVSKLLEFTRSVFYAIEIWACRLVIEPFIKPLSLFFELILVTPQVLLRISWDVKYWDSLFLVVWSIAWLWYNEKWSPPIIPGVLVSLRY